MIESFKLLVVDDDPGFVETLKDILEASGYQTEAAGSGEEALDKAVVGHYNFIFMDIMMKGLSGIEAMKRIREAGTETPIILMTAYHRDSELAAAVKECGTAVIKKPLDMDSMLEFLKQSAKPPRVAVLDDDEGMRTMLVRFLASQGFSAVATGEPERLFELIDREEVDAAVLDMNLQRSDGLEVFENLRTIRPELLVVLISGFPAKMDGKIEQARQLGAYAGLTKPFKPEELVSILRRGLAEKRLQLLAG